jgi:hypothetical protein
MKVLGAVLRELVGLFVDDGALALEIVAVVVVAGISANLVPEVPLAAGAILLLGCLGVLFANVSTGQRRWACLRRSGQGNDPGRSNG